MSDFYILTDNNMNKVTHKQVDEVNMLFEMIKTILITWLSAQKVKKFLKTYTHYEIRCGHYEGGKFVVENHIIHDAEFVRQHTASMANKPFWD